MKRYQKYLSLLLIFVAFNSNALQCGAGEVEVEGVCVSSCKILKGTGKNLTWDAYIWGDNPRSYCIGDRSTGAACRMTAGSVSISVEGNKWTNKFTYTGSTCAFDEINRFSGDTPEPFPFENDVNQNGVNDDFEDWDGDGLTNANDPNPYQPENPAPDENRNGIPDDIEGVYEELRHTQEILYCNNDDDMCHQMRYAMRDLTKSNQILANSLSNASLKNVRRTDFRESVGALTTTVNQKSQAILDAVNSIEVGGGGGVDNSGIIKKGFSDMESGFANMETNFDDLDYNVFRTMSNISSIDRGMTSLNTQVNGVHGHLDETKSDIISAINNGSGGLTQTQKNQLKNAAKANANQKLIKELKTTVGENGYTLSRIKNDIGNVADDVNQNTNEKFNQLSDQIASISGGQSTIDLSGVESSISDLSAKIDGLEVGDMSGVEGKIDDLIKGITNNNDFVEPSSGFDGVGFIVNQNQIAEVQNEVLEIKQEMADEFEKFKTLFSIDTSSFNNGTFKEHTLNLNINGSERSFKSGVFSALLDNAAIISAVIMFLFVLSGIRMLGKD